MRIAHTVLLVGLGGLASFLVLGPCLCSASISNYYEESSGEDTRFFHLNNDLTAECFTSAVIIGVGTAMTRNDYNRLALAMLNELDDPQVLLAIVDPVPHSPIKLYPKPFARAINRLVAQLHRDEPALSSSPVFHHFCPDKNATIVVGGHSASGSAAFYGSNFFDFPVAGFLGLDPFPIHWQHHYLSVPALYWGFSCATCDVSVSHAALAAFNESKTGQRVLYQIQNTEKKEHQASNSSCRYSHCAFTDTGCFVVCPLRCPDASANDLRHDVAVSLRLFLTAIKDERPQRSFTRNYFASGDFRMDSSETLILLDDDDEEFFEMNNQESKQHASLVA